MTRPTPPTLWLRLTTRYPALASLALLGAATLLLLVPFALWQARERAKERQVRQNASLSEAAMHGETERVRSLLRQGAEVNSSVVPPGVFANWWGKATPLIEAAGDGHNDVVRVLLDAGADIEARADDGMTALMNAAFYGHAATVQLLLSRGANPNARDGSGRTALDRARAMARSLARSRARQAPDLDNLPIDANFGDAAGYRETIRLLETAGAKE